MFFCNGPIFSVCSKYPDNPRKGGKPERIGDGREISPWSMPDSPSLWLSISLNGPAAFDHGLFALITDM
ncbi:hypothetical protein B7C51_06700 [Paenibacillus larvae subsp. pulvifaciens]|uniref:Uncharacterized protein n=1 Tax=Paenibacillus larvae subsp. pulvifaciens TaxID=1477 RepID=A0A1V0UR40_9BACL|nr:hypothetical protein BXP28_11275 [Paenibacillus larvae subsp. larvae]ARF67577.1 hypothetical protein B7C51_06700 [Paenibacillus larvae subsp. pulvifaciens]AVG13352.1 hypothetical protein ERICII_03012 [Paenibacillus larvae subsp. larvae DSM 25430]